ncbi:hypothetical protein [Streptomyces sp. NPDC001404]|uniref:hypothetical protein n=1 Tax=Streptomyces sp. NPDC001404 TaxID=3364571 RepID=UPI0036BD918D
MERTHNQSADESPTPSGNRIIDEAATVDRCAEDYANGPYGRTPDEESGRS